LGFGQKWLKPNQTKLPQHYVLDDDEIAIPIEPDKPLFSAIDTITSTDALLCSVRDDTALDPATISEARKSKYWTEWLTAIHGELVSLKVKGVYEEVKNLPPGRKAVQCKWVLHIKRDKVGDISRFKAHLVAKGFTQIPGQDFTFTFTPIAVLPVGIRSAPSCVSQLSRTTRFGNLM
jgi:hypothetical protein